MSTPLGRRMHFHAFALRGFLENEQWRAVLVDVTAAIDMENAGSAAEWVYPLPNGAGGQGATIVQPITESFLALDTWPDHEGAYLLVCSCRPFRPEDIGFVFRRWGLEVLGEANHRLEIHS